MGSRRGRGLHGNELVQLAGDKLKIENTHGTAAKHLRRRLLRNPAAGRDWWRAATLAKAYVTRPRKRLRRRQGRVPLDHFYRLKN